MIATNAAHKPFTPKKQDLDKYSKVKVPKSVKSFYALISNIDENLGILDQKLRDLKLQEKTILIFVSDNGSAGYHYNAGYKGWKTSEFDGGHRVPFFIRFPQLFTQPRDVNALTAHIDVLPTLVDLCDLSYKASKGFELDGISLKGLLTNDEATEMKPEKRILVVENQRIDQPRKWKNTAVMMMDAEGNDWRLMNKEKKLYNLLEGKSQKKNLLKKNKGIAKEMGRFYDDWWRSVSQNDNLISRYSIGGAQETVFLTAHDWQGTKYIPWSQSDIKSKGCIKKEGYWPLYVESGGLYKFEVSRWPKEANLPIKDGNKMKYKFAEISIDGRKQSQLIFDSTLNVSFEESLEKGEINLSARFGEKEGKTCGAYYVYVTKV